LLLGFENPFIEGHTRQQLLSLMVNKKSSEFIVIFWFGGAKANGEGSIPDFETGSVRRIAA
jgi:hypothetical protein